MRSILSQWEVARSSEFEVVDAKERTRHRERAWCTRSSPSDAELQTEPAGVSHAAHPTQGMCDDSVYAGAIGHGLNRSAVLSDEQNPSTTMASSPPMCVHIAASERGALRRSHIETNRKNVLAGRVRRRSLVIILLGLR